MLVALVILVLATRCVGEDICQVCECLPSSESPLQAYCGDEGTDSDKVFWPTTSFHEMSLQLVYIYGMKTVNFDQNAFITEKSLDLLIHNCSEVHISDNSLNNNLRSLVMRDIKMVNLGVLGYSELWSIMLEDIEQLSVSDACFEANYSIKIGNVRSLTVIPTHERNYENSGLRFSLTNSEVKDIPEGGLTIIGQKIYLKSNTFNSIAEGGLQFSAESSIEITNNHFKHIEKRAFNLTSPGINISNNNFDNFPAGALSDISTIQDTFFTNNKIQDIDLGGVLLDMGWDMTIEKNMINCDCASKRTSILNPKEDMLVLTNSSHETLQNIFLNNYCSLNCTVTLKDFSYALKQGDVCLTNQTQLEDGKLCDVSVLPNNGLEDENDQSLVSAASRVEFLVPLSLIVITIFITSSVCYGCKEMKTFKFVFSPHTSSAPKLPTE